MQTVAVVFPNQLFPVCPVLSQASTVFLLEHPRFFHAFRFHKKKLLLHRASMRAYADELEKKGHTVRYVEQVDLKAPGRLEEIVRASDPECLRMVDPTDAALADEFKALAKQLSCPLEVLESPQFMCESDAARASFKGRKRLSMAHFYRAQRRRFGILMDEDKPVGGKWSFDDENRRALPQDVKVPRRPKAGFSEYVREAAAYVERHFPDNPGSTEGFFYPVRTGEARRWLKRFLDRRLALFGPYEDAISTDRPFLFHSLLSPLLNTGLLTPADVIVRTLKFSEGRTVPLNSLEGFIRQIIGWREFIRVAYLLIGREQRASNFWRCRNMLPASFYTAKTAMEPVDVVIRRVLDNAFAHHIERLMILGNFMLLCEIHPDEVYRWFMEMFIDGYDWVMTPNVYGMSQYADGGRVTTKPYISSSNYVRKMSDFPHGAWCDVWDALFWRFIHKHRKVILKNPRMSVMARQVDRMAHATLKSHIHLAECYLATLFRH